MITVYQTLSKTSQVSFINEHITYTKIQTVSVKLKHWKHWNWTTLGMENKLIYPYVYWATDNERAPRLRIIFKDYKKQNEIKIILQNILLSWQRNGNQTFLIILLVNASSSTYINSIDKLNIIIILSFSAHVWCIEHIYG